MQIKTAEPWRAQDLFGQQQAVGRHNRQVCPQLPQRDLRLDVAKGCGRENPQTGALGFLVDVRPGRLKTAPTRGPRRFREYPDDLRAEVQKRA